VKIRVAGVVAIKDVLGWLPRNESVNWCDELHIGQITETDFQLPSAQTTYSIEEYARQRGLDLAITVR